MRFISIGTASSEAELKAVRDRARGNKDRLCEYVALLKGIEWLESRGDIAEGWRWLPVPHFNEVNVFIGDKGRNRTAIWAAVEVGVISRVVTLLKMVDTYGDDVQEHEWLLQDALDRKQRGTRYG
jgi:hypothetical protein